MRRCALFAICFALVVPCRSYGAPVRIILHASSHSRQQGDGAPWSTVGVQGRDWRVWTVDGYAQDTHWLNTMSVTKQGGSTRISDLVCDDGDTLAIGTDSYWAVSWDGGTPQPQGSDAHSFVYGKSLTFSAPADTKPRHLVLYAVTWATDAQLSASIIDGDHEVYSVSKRVLRTDLNDPDDPDHGYYRWDIYYAGTGPDQALSIVWQRQNPSNPSGNVGLQAATVDEIAHPLSIPPPPTDPPTTSARPHIATKAMPDYVHMHNRPWPMEPYMIWFSHIGRLLGATKQTVVNTVGPPDGVVTDLGGGVEYTYDEKSTTFRPGTLFARYTYYFGPGPQDRLTRVNFSYSHNITRYLDFRRRQTMYEDDCQPAVYIWQCCGGTTTRSPHVISYDSEYLRNCFLYPDAYGTTELGTNRRLVGGRLDGLLPNGVHIYLSVVTVPLQIGRRQFNTTTNQYDIAYQTNTEFRWDLAPVTAVEWSIEPIDDSSRAMVHFDVPHGG